MHSRSLRYGAQPSRPAAEGALAVVLAGLAARALGVRLRLALGEGRGLALPRPHEFIDLATELRHLGLEGAHARAVVAVQAAHSALDLVRGLRIISAYAAPG